MQFLLLGLQRIYDEIMHKINRLILFSNNKSIINCIKLNDALLDADSEKIMRSYALGD